MTLKHPFRYRFDECTEQMTFDLILKLPPMFIGDRHEDKPTRPTDDGNEEEIV